jgi:hypothetical protein
MSNLAICSLVYGNEHLFEFNRLIKSIKNVPIYAYTNLYDISINSKVNLIFGDLPFNFNLKRFAIKKAFKKYDTILCMDTDIVSKYNFDTEFDLEDGIYTFWKGDVQMYKNTKLSINKFINKTSEIEELNSYADGLIKCGATIDNIKFFDEWAFIIKIKNEDIRNQFIDKWDDINSKTLEMQPKDRHVGELNGALESLIISLAASKCNLKIYSNNIQTIPLFESLTHYNSININNKSLI